MIRARTQLLNNRFLAVGRQIRSEERAARARAGAVGAAVAKKRCPRSGNNEAGHVHLQDTIRFEVDTNGDVYLLAGNERVTWAKYVNSGTVFVAPRPFHTQGTAAMKSQAAKEYRRMTIR